MLDLVQLISDAYVAKLAEVGWPPLADLPNGEKGRIVIADPQQVGNYVPPRVVFRPFDGGLSTLSDTVRANPNGFAYTPEDRQAIANPAFGSEAQGWDVSCWGVCPVNEDVEPNAAALDYDFARGLYTTLIATMHALMEGCFKLLPGKWDRTRQVQRVGRVFTFRVQIGVPILYRLAPPAVSGWVPGSPSQWAPKADPPVTPPGLIPAPIQYAPDDVAPDITDQMQFPDGSSESGCEEPDDT